METLKGDCMHEIDLNEDWCVFVCIPLPPLSRTHLLSKIQIML